jgi:hypothetical protein
VKRVAAENGFVLLARDADSSDVLRGRAAYAGTRLVCDRPNAERVVIGRILDRPRLEKPSPEVPLFLNKWKSDTCGVVKTAPLGLQDFRSHEAPSVATP